MYDKFNNTGTPPIFEIIGAGSYIITFLGYTMVGYSMEVTNSGIYPSVPWFSFPLLITSNAANVQIPPNALHCVQISFWDLRTYTFNTTDAINSTITIKFRLL